MIEARQAVGEAAVLPATAIGAVLAAAAISAAAARAEIGKDNSGFKIEIYILNSES